MGGNPFVSLRFSQLWWCISPIENQAQFCAVSTLENSLGKAQRAAGRPNKTVCQPVNTGEFTSILLVCPFLFSFVPSPCLLLPSSPSSVYLSKSCHLMNTCYQPDAGLEVGVRTPGGRPLQQVSSDLFMWQPYPKKAVSGNSRASHS